LIGKYSNKNSGNVKLQLIMKVEIKPIYHGWGLFFGTKVCFGNANKIDTKKILK